MFSKYRYFQYFSDKLVRPTTVEGIMFCRCAIFLYSFSTFRQIIGWATAPKVYQLLGNRLKSKNSLRHLTDLFPMFYTRSTSPWFFRDVWHTSSLYLRRPLAARGMRQ